MTEQEINAALDGINPLWLEVVDIVTPQKRAHLAALKKEHPDWGLDDLGEEMFVTDRSAVLAEAERLIEEAGETLALAFGNSGTGCPHWLADIYAHVDGALLAIRATDTKPEFAVAKAAGGLRLVGDP